MAKAKGASKPVNTTVPEALPSKAERGSLSFMIHDVLLLECEYEKLDSNVRINVRKTHLTGSLEALLTKLVGASLPVLASDRAGGAVVSGTEPAGELEEIAVDDVIDSLSAGATAPPKLQHDGQQPKLPEAASRLSEVTPPVEEVDEDLAAAQEVDAFAVGELDELEEVGSGNQSADGEEATQVEEAEELEELEDLGSGDQAELEIAEVEDVGVGDSQVHEIEDVEELDAADDAIEIEEVEFDDVPELESTGTTVRGQADVTQPVGGHSIGNDDAEIEVEEVNLEAVAVAEAEQSDEDADDELPFDAPDEVADIGEAPEPVGTKKSDKKTQEAVNKAKQAQAKPAAASNKTATAAANSKPTNKPAELPPIEGLVIPTTKALHALTEKLSEAQQAQVLKIRETFSAHCKELDGLDRYAPRIVGTAWPELKKKFKGRPIVEAHRYLLYEFIRKLAPKSE